MSLTTQEEAPSGPPRGVRVEAVSSTQLRVTWQVREQLCCVVKLERFAKISKSRRAVSWLTLC